MTVRIAPFGDAAIAIELEPSGEVAIDAARARRLAGAIDRARIAGVAATVVGYGEVTVHLDDDARLAPAQRALEDLVARASSTLDHDETHDETHFRTAAERPVRVHQVRATYDGPDLDAVAAACALPRAEVVRRHAAALYVVEILGFLPGFAYLGGLDSSLCLARRATPRARVEALSIGIAGARTAIYPRASPGGWQLIGRALDVAPFDPDRSPPALFAPGDRVRFLPVEQPGARR